MKASYYKELIVWQKSVELVGLIYKLARDLPNSEKFGLCSQIQRAAVSIPSNIAEGYMRQGNKEYKHFLYTSLGSAAELETQLVLCRNLRLSSQEKIDKSEELLTEVIKMLRAMIKKLPE